MIKATFAVNGRPAFVGLNAALVLAGALLAGLASLAADASASTLTPEEQQTADAFDKTTLLAKKETDAIAAQTALAKAKVAAATPASGEGVAPPTGSFTGANNLTFAVYMLSMDGLQRIAQAVCNDLDQNGIKEAYTSAKDVSEAVAKDEAFRRARDQLANKLRSATVQARQMRASIDGSAGSGERISAASLATVASGIDVAYGLVKGAAGLTSLFKSDRKVEPIESLLGTNEVAAALSMCVADSQKQAKAPRLINIDSDLSNLAAVVGSLSNEVNDISNLSAGLDASLNDLSTASNALDRERKKAADAKDNASMAALDARRPINYSAFTTKAGTLVSAAQAYVDSMYQVDATSGLSPLIVAAQFRTLRNAATAAGASNRLVLTLLHSSGYALTTKQLFFSERVDFAGGVAVHASVVDASGVAVYDRILFRDSGWTRADPESGGAAVPRQNF